MVMVMVMVMVIVMANYAIIEINISRHRPDLLDFDSLDSEDWAGWAFMITMTTKMTMTISCWEFWYFFGGPWIENCWSQGRALSATQPVWLNLYSLYSLKIIQLSSIVAFYLGMVFNWSWPLIKEKGGANLIRAINFVSGVTDTCDINRNMQLYSYFLPFVSTKSKFFCLTPLCFLFLFDWIEFGWVGTWQEVQQQQNRGVDFFKSWFIIIWIC